MKKNNNKTNKAKKSSIYDFVGILSKKDSAEMKKVIEETCETLDPNEWK